MLTITDLFCGAGGSSSGAETVPGVRVRMAANHWQLAVDSHNANFPHADHDCADISATDPRRYPTTDLLWASPECTNHSQAKGVRRRNLNQTDLFDERVPDEAAERSRATMWDVPRFAERHAYRAIVVENVVDARHWVMFDAWLMAMTALGYEHAIVYLNSMVLGDPQVVPAPQSRDRMYVVFWRAGERKPDLDIRAACWCASCEQQVDGRQSWKRPERPWGRYGARAQYVYTCPRCGDVAFPLVRPAAVAVDWSLPSQRIGDRDKPLKPATLARIQAGLDLHCRPITVEAAGNTYERPGSNYKRAWPVDEPLTTQTTTLTKGLACPPFVMRHYTPRNSLAQMCTSLDEPLPTQTASFLPSLVEPMMVPVEAREGKQATSALAPLRTQTARLETGLVQGPAPQPFLVILKTHATAKPLTEPFTTVLAGAQHHGLAFPAFVMRNNTGGAEMCTPATEPLRTLTSKGHQSLVEWPEHMLVPYYRTGVAKPVTAPAATVTTHDRQALVKGAVDINDCLFRMLEPHEIAAAMAFPGGYVVLGNNRERVRMYGNAVTPPAAAVLIRRVVEALVGEAA